MPKRKKIEGSYNNVVEEKIYKRYFNKWIENPNDFGLKMYSYFIVAEATSAIQLIVCSNPIYNGIFHLTKFEFVNEDSIRINDFELLKESKDNSFNNLMIYIKEISDKYSGEIVEEKILHTNPLENLLKYPIPQLKML